VDLYLIVVSNVFKFTVGGGQFLSHNHYLIFRVTFLIF